MIVLNSKGQTLIAVMMVMLIALAVGLAASQRIIGGRSRTTKMDTAARATAAAEAGIEKFLALPTETLDNYIQNGSCGGECHISLTGSDGIVTNADISLSYAASTTSIYNINIGRNDNYEIALDGYGSNELELCWDNGPAGVNPSIYVMYVYGSAPYSLETYAYNSVVTSYSTNGFASAAADLSYLNCATLPGHNDPKFVRVRAIYADLALHVIPKGGASLPIQGYIIKSTGYLNDIKRSITAVKSRPYLPPSYDFAIFSTSSTQPFEN